jgi:hypothetical protein
MFEYTVEMWLLPVLDPALETNQTGFTAFEMRLTIPIPSTRISGDGKSICGDNYDSIAYGCDVRRNAIIYTHEKGWMWNYGYQLQNQWRFHVPIFTPTFDMERLRVRSGVPVHVAVTFQAVAAVALGFKDAYDDQVATLYVNGIRVGSTVVYNRQGSEFFGMFFGPWLGNHPNATTRSLTVTEGTPFTLDSSAVEGMFIDEVRVWRRPLAQREIMANMFKPVNTSADDLLVYWSFDEADSYRVNATADGLINRIAASQGRDWNGYVLNTTTETPDKYFGATSWDEGIFPLFEESFVPTSANWTYLIPPFSRVTLDATVTRGDLDGFPIVHFGAMSAVVGRTLYVYGGSQAASSFVGTEPLNKLWAWNLDSKKWRVIQTLGGNTDPGLFGSATIVDGTKVWFFGGSFSKPTICHFDTAQLFIEIECIDDATWINEVGSLGGMSSVVIGRTVWFFGGATLIGGSIFPSDAVVSFNLDSYNVTVINNPGGTAEWPPSRIFACFTPYGDTRAVLYGGITGLQDQGGLKQMYLFDPAAKSGQSIWTIFPVDPTLIPTVSGWSSCSALPNTMIIYSGTVGFGIATVFSLTTAAATVDQDLKYDTLTILRLNETDARSSYFEIMKPDNGYDFAGGLTPIRLAHAVALTPDGSHLVSTAGLALDTRAELGDKAESWTERYTYYVRLGCPAGSIAQAPNETDPFSFHCVTCPVGFYQPQAYPKDMTSAQCLPCPTGSFSGVGSAQCQTCEINTIPRLSNTTLNGTICEPCESGYITVAKGDTACILRPAEPAEQLQSDNRAAIVAGVLSGLAAVGGGIAAFYLIRWRRRIQSSFPGALSDRLSLTNVFLRTRNRCQGSESKSGRFQLRFP